jgi:YfiH family protein
MFCGRNPVLQPDWAAPANVHAFVTTRSGGVSQAPFDSFNLATHVGDAPAAVSHNRQLLRRRLALPGEPLWLTQVHGTQVIDAGGAAPGDTADASFTRQPGVVSAVLTADCLPVLFCDTAGSCVAAAHAGWRGLAAGVLEATIAAMAVEPGRLMAWLGPAIGPAAFAVGAEVRAAFVDQHPLAHSAFQAVRGGHWLADLYALARIRLAAAGVPAVSGGGLCTSTDVERFYSYRRDGVTGRMAALIWMV